LSRIPIASNIFSRILWLICYLLSLSVCSFFIISTIISYFKYDKAVHVSRIEESPTIFPAITICNLNPYNFQKPEVANYLETLLNESDFSHVFTENGFQGFFTLTNSLKSLVEEANLSYEKRWELGFELDQMLIRCSFNQKPCNSTWFKPFIDYNYGNCSQSIDKCWKNVGNTRM
jgi:hypothetical protein